MSNLVIPDGGNIGSASDTDAIAISSGGNVTLSQTLDGGAIGSAVTMSANQACVKTALNASGSAPIYACRAWVNFNGTGTPATRSSGNVSSITDNGTGDYTVNFTTAMPDANYSAVGVCKQNETGNSWRVATPAFANSDSSCRWVCILSVDGTAEDMTSVYVAVFR